MPATLTRHTVGGLRYYHATLTASGAESEIAHVWDPPEEGYSLDILISTDWTAVDLTLDAGYTPEVGDILNVNVRHASSDQAEVAISLTGIGEMILDAGNTPVQFIYELDETSTGAWRVNSQTTDAERRVTLGLLDQFHEKQVVLEYPGVTMDAARQSFGAELGDGLVAVAYERDLSASEAPGFIWVGRPEDPFLQLCSGSPPYVTQAIYSNGSTMLALGGRVTSSVDGHVSTAASAVPGVSWTPVALPYAGGKLTCQPSRAGNNVVMVLRTATEDVVYGSGDFGATWSYVAGFTVGSVNAVHVASSASTALVTIGVGDEIHRTTIVSGTLGTFGLIISASNDVTYAGPALGGGTLVCTDGGPSYVIPSASSNFFTGGDSRYAARQFYGLTSMAISPHYTDSRDAFAVAGFRNQSGVYAMGFSTHEHEVTNGYSLYPFGLFPGQWGMYYVTGSGTKVTDATTWASGWPGLLRYWRFGS